MTVHGRAATSARARSCTPATTGVRGRTITSAVELGVKFRSDVAGSITGDPLLQDLRRTRAPTPARCGRPTGANLGTVTFSGESATGWQEATFGAPIPIAADTTYVASYHTTVGQLRHRHVVRDGRRRQPPAARARRTATTGPTASTRTAPAGSIPTRPSASSNYLVDVVFVDQAVPDTTAADDHAARSGRGRVRRRRRGQRHRDVQRADGSARSATTTFELRDAVERPRCRRPSPTTPARGRRSSNPTATSTRQHDLHGDRAGRRRRSSRTPPDNALAADAHLVVHDGRAAAAAARRGPRRADPRRVGGRRTRSAATTRRSSGTKA